MQPAEEQQLQHLQGLVEVLFVDKVEVLSAKYWARYVSGPPAASSFREGEFAQAVRKDSKRADRLSQILKANGAMELEEFTGLLDGDYAAMMMNGERA